MKKFVSLAKSSIGPVLAAAFVLTAGSAFAGPVQGSDAINCANCSSANLQVAQLVPRPGGLPTQAVQAIIPRDQLLQEGNRGLSTCCDPKLAGFKIKSMFAEDMILGQPFGAAYGVTWNPSGNIPFLEAMENTAFIANVMAGVSYSHFILEAELRTKNVKGQPLPATAAATMAEWAGGTTMTPGWPTFIGVWDSPWLPSSDPNFNLNWNHFNPFNRTTVATSGPAHPTGTVAPHFRADGTLYSVRFSYAMAYFVNGIWTRRAVYCNNARPQYWVFQKGDTSASKLAGGASGGLQSVTFDADPISEGRGVTLGAPVPMRPDEIARLPNGGRIPQRN
jgi:hypothetical protein